MLEELHELSEIVRNRPKTPFEAPVVYTKEQRRHIMLGEHVELKYTKIIFTPSADAHLVEFEDRRKPVWFPKAHCEIDEENKIIFVSEWCYNKKVVEGQIKALKDTNKILAKNIKSGTPESDLSEIVESILEWWKKYRGVYSQIPAFVIKAKSIKYK